MIRYSGLRRKKIGIRMARRPPISERREQQETLASHDPVAPVAEANDWISQWIAEWGDALARFVLSYTHDRELAQDIAQETFWRLYQWHEAHPHQTIHGGWLFTTARHLIIDAHRRRHLPRNGGEGERIESPASAMDQQIVQRLAVQTVLDHLRPTDRECLWLFYYQSLSIAQIAQILQLSEAGVRVRLYRARKRFAQLWKEDDHAPQG